MRGVLISNFTIADLREMKQGLKDLCFKGSLKTK